MAAAAVPTVGIFNQQTLPSVPAGGGGLLGTAWYYNSSSGAVQEDAVAAADLADLLGLGWHGPFNSKTDALYFYTSNAAANPGWKAPAGVGANIGNALNASTGNAVPNAAKAIGGASALMGKAGRLMDDLTSGAFWLRAGEVIAGLILLGIGVNSLFKGKPMAAVTSAAGKLAPLAVA